MTTEPTVTADPAPSQKDTANPHYNRPLAVLYAVISSACLAVLWSIVRHLSERLESVEITFFASLAGLLVFMPWVVRAGGKIFYTHRLWTHLLRGLFNSCGIITWFAALTMLPLADAAALGLMMPLLIVVGAIVFLGERVRVRRWSALIFGGMGALIIIRPGFETVTLGVWLVLVTVLFAACQRLLAKSLVRTDGSETCVAYLMVSMTPITLIPALFVWQWPTLAEYGWFAVAGVLLTGAHFTLVKSLSLADISALEPVAFTRLVWAALLGFVLFSEVPDIWTWVGGAMIVVAASYVARRETAVVKSPGERPASAPAE